MDMHNVDRHYGDTRSGLIAQWLWRIQLAMLADRNMTPGYRSLCCQPSEDFLCVFALYLLINFEGVNCTAAGTTVIPVMKETHRCCLALGVGVRSWLEYNRLL